MPRTQALGPRPEYPLSRDAPELHELDASPDGFTWINADDSEQSVLSLVRKGHSTSADEVLFVVNFTPIPRYNYRVGVPLDPATGPRSSTAMPRSMEGAARATEAAFRPVRSMPTARSSRST